MPSENKHPHPRCRNRDPDRIFFLEQQHNKKDKIYVNKLWVDPEWKDSKIELDIDNEPDTDSWDEDVDEDEIKDEKSVLEKEDVFVFQSAEIEEDLVKKIDGKKRKRKT